MKLITRLLWTLIICFLFPLHGFTYHKQRAESETVTTNRLVGLCKLWGQVKYFHPSLAYRSDIDWDAALMMTIPKVRNAKTPAEYAAALQGLLKAVDDPATNIVIGPPSATAPEDSDNRQLAHQLTEDGLLVITAGNYYELWSQASQDKLKAIVAEVTKAKAIVFDLRSTKPIDPYGKLQLTSSFSQVERLILARPLLTTGERSLVRKGLENSSPFSSGQYKSGFYIQNVKRLTPAPGAKEIPSIFIINRNSALLDSTPKLQAAGQGLVVFDGEGDANSLVKAELLDLGEGVSAQVRLVEPLLEDGTSGDLQPDVVVSEIDKKSDVALNTALRLVHRHDEFDG